MKVRPELRRWGRVRSGCAARLRPHPQRLTRTRRPTNPSGGGCIECRVVARHLCSRYLRNKMRKERGRAKTGGYFSWTVEDPPRCTHQRTLFYLLKRGEDVKEGRQEGERVGGERERYPNLTLHEVVHHPDWCMLRSPPDVRNSFPRTKSHHVLEKRPKVMGDPPRGHHLPCEKRI